jgi:hypothetical protein
MAMTGAGLEERLLCFAAEVSGAVTGDNVAVHMQGSGLLYDR